MKIVFVSNFYNHHQAFLSRKLYELTGGNFRFVECEEIPIERKLLGYNNIRDRFLLNYNRDIENVKNWIDTADIVVIGSASEELLRNRKKCKKVIFRYYERPLKKGLQWWKYPIRWYRWHRDNPSRVPIYMLCASAYTALDYGKFGLYKNRTYKWGYFPELKKYNDIETILKKKNYTEILWCGRLLEWKHPDDVLVVSKRLKDEGYRFHVSIIGTGDMEEQLKCYCENNKLTDTISFLGTMSPDKVRVYMESSGIYLFTSDRNEGWGAVLNEAMNSGCAVVASHLAGATPFLINNGTNGLVYSSGDVDMLYEKVKYVLEHPNEQKKMGMLAYETIINEWNAEIAAKRFIELSKSILERKQSFMKYSSGPCSFAGYVSEKYLGDQL